MLDSALAGSLVVPDSTRYHLQQVITQWFFRVDGRAHDRIANTILDVIRAHAPDAHVRRCRAIARPDRRSHPRWRERARATSRALLKTNLPPAVARFRRGRAESAWRRSEKHFDDGDIRRLIDLLASASPDSHSTEITVGLARTRGDYRLPLRFGQSVTLTSD
jgi:hypothetical protein